MARRALRGIVPNTLEAQHYDRLRQRRDWLVERIQAKHKVGWDVVYDLAECNALTWALKQLDEKRNG